MGSKLERVAIFMAWPYANGPPHLGHVAGNCLPADIQFRYERARGRSVLMCSGSDEHGTPITLTAEQEGVAPLDVVDKFHSVISKALVDLGCSWATNVDPRGVEYGGLCITGPPIHGTRILSGMSSLNFSTPIYWNRHRCSSTAR